MVERKKEIESHPAFMDVTREQANDMLQFEPKGTYLLRYQTEEGQYVLSYVINDRKIDHVSFYITPAGTLHSFIMKQDQSSSSQVFSKLNKFSRDEHEEEEEEETPDLEKREKSDAFLDVFSRENLITKSYSKRK